jgi:cell division protein ZipA
MDEHTLIVMAVVVISLGMLLAAIRKKRAREEEEQELIQKAKMQAGNAETEGIISKRVIGVNPEHHGEVFFPKRMPKNHKLIIFNLMARAGQSFSGYELYQTLLDAGLTHNEYGVFEYLENIDGVDVSLFSLASMDEPGTFDVHNMGSCICFGLSLFMSINQTHVAFAFKTMLKQIEYLADVLQADVLDDQHQPCSQKYFDDCRTRVAGMYQRVAVEPLM